MAYMGQDRKKELVAGLKVALKGRNIKYSVSVRHHSTIVLTIKKGAVDFFGALKKPSGPYAAESIEYCKTERYLQVNVYHLDSNFEKGEALDILEAAYSALMVGNHNNSDAMTDYFDVGWYVDINIGAWDKPYELEGAVESKPESEIDKVLAEPFFDAVEKEPVVVVPEPAPLLFKKLDSTLAEPKPVVLPAFPEPVTAVVEPEEKKGPLVYKVRLESCGHLACNVTRCTGADDIAELAAEVLVGADREYVLRIDLDAKNKILGVETVAMGGLHGAALTPRDVLKGAFLANASGFVLCHNHPSGDPTPSQSDLDMTKLLATACKTVGLQLLDHVIVTPDRKVYSSIRETFPAVVLV